MDYPFSHVEHRIYRNTFLKDVRVSVGFSQKEASTVNHERLQDFFHRFDGANINVEDFLSKGFIFVYSNKYGIEFRFSLAFAEAKLSAPFYTSFDGAKTYWNLLIEFLKAMDVSQVESLVVRKFNALYFKSNKPDYDIREVMDTLFCDELMKLVPEGLSDDTSLNSVERTWSKKDEKSGTECNIVFGIKKADSTEKEDCLTLVTLVKLLGSPINIETIMDMASVYNNILFDAFHWCVKEDIIKDMM